MLEVPDTAFHMGQDLRLEGVVVHGGHAVDPQPLFGGLGIAQRSFELEPEASELFLMTRHDGLDRLDRQHVYHPGLERYFPRYDALRHDPPPRHPTAGPPRRPGSARRSEGR